VRKTKITCDNCGKDFDEVEHSLNIGIPFVQIAYFSKHHTDAPYKLKDCCTPECALAKLQDDVNLYKNIIDKWHRRLGE